MPTVQVWGEGVVWPCEHSLVSPDPLTYQLNPERSRRAAKIGQVRLAAGNVYPGGLILGEIVNTGRFAPYDSSLIAAGSAPVVSEGIAGVLLAGVYEVAYTYLDQLGGESLPSVSGFVTITDDHEIHIAAITPLPEGASAVKWYCSESPDSAVLRLITTNSGSAFDITALPVSLEIPPITPTAFVHADGRHVAKGVNKYTVYTNADGSIMRGSVPFQSEWGNPVEQTEMWWSGVFLTAELTGLDDRAVLQLGRLLNGTITDGRIVLYGP